MQSVADFYRKRAEECRRLAILGANRRDWGHFEEMAVTWEKLADLHELGSRLRASGALLDPPASSRSEILDTAKAHSYKKAA
jgi:hypothetical protein